VCWAAAVVVWVVVLGAAGAGVLGGQHPTGHPLACDTHSSTWRQGDRQQHYSRANVGQHVPRQAVHADVICKLSCYLLAISMSRCLQSTALPPMNIHIGPHSCLTGCGTPRSCLAAPSNAPLLRPHLSTTAPGGVGPTAATAGPSWQLNTKSSACSLCMQGVAKSRLLSISTSPMPPVPPPAPPPPAAAPVSARGLSVLLPRAGPNPPRAPACGSVASSFAIAVDAGPIAKGSSLWPRTRDRSANACDSSERPEEAPRAPASVSSSVRASLAEKPAGRPDRLQQQRHRDAGVKGGVGGGGGAAISVHWM
jgi:hypothetical protein